MNAEEIRKKARFILGNTSIDTGIGEEKNLKILQKIVDSKLDNDLELELAEKTVELIGDYLHGKSIKLTQKRDKEYLSSLAEILRTQKVRLGDGVYLENPVFKVTSTGEDKVSFYFLTKEGADKFIEANSTLVEIKETKNDKGEERRKQDLFTVESNKNLELERLLEIIKRNF